MLDCTVGSEASTGSVALSTAVGAVQWAGGVITAVWASCEDSDEVRRESQVSVATVCG